MFNQNQPHPEYDFPTAVTFLLAGLAVGAVLAMLWSPLRGDSPSERLSRDRSLVSQRSVPVGVE